VANGKILRDGPFDDIWIQPAAGDAGGALGVALSLWHRYLDRPRLSPERAGTWVPSRAWRDTTGPPPYADGMRGGFLGPRSSEDEIAQWVQRHGYAARRCAPGEVAEIVASLLAEEKVVALCQGRME